MVKELTPHGVTVELVSAGCRSHAVVPTAVPTPHSIHQICSIRDARRSGAMLSASVQPLVPPVAH